MSQSLYRVRTIGSQEEITALVLARSIETAASLFMRSVGADETSYAANALEDIEGLAVGQIMDATHARQREQVLMEPIEKILMKSEIEKSAAPEVEEPTW